MCEPCSETTWSYGRNLELVVWNSTGHLHRKKQDFVVETYSARNSCRNFLASAHTHIFKKKPQGWPVAVRNDSCPEGFAWLKGSMREAVSRANTFADACASVIFESTRQGIPVALFHTTGSYMWSLDAYCRLRELQPTVSHLDWCQFGSRFRGRTTIWSWNLEMPTVLPTCHPNGDICSWSGKQHKDWKSRSQSARASGTLSIPGHCRLLVFKYLGTECAGLSLEYLPPLNP